MQALGHPAQIYTNKVQSLRQTAVIPIQGKMLIPIQEIACRVLADAGHEPFFNTPADSLRILFPSKVINWQ